MNLKGWIGMIKFSEIVETKEEREEIKAFKEKFNAQEVKIWDKGKLVFSWTKNKSGRVAPE